MKLPVMLSLAGSLLLTVAVVVVLWLDTGVSPPPEEMAEKGEPFVAHREREHQLDSVEVAAVAVDAIESARDITPVEAEAPPLAKAEDVRGFTEEELRQVLC